MSASGDAACFWLREIFHLEVRVLLYRGYRQRLVSWNSRTYQFLQPNHQGAFRQSHEASKKWRTHASSLFIMAKSKWVLISLCKKASEWNFIWNRSVLLLWSDSGWNTRCFTTEQLTFVLRYTVLKNGNWEVVERFLTVKDFEKKKGEDICKAILSILEDHKIDIGRCRGQGYDNGSNMSRCYKGVQALFLEKNPLTKIPHEHVPKSHVITCDYMCDHMWLHVILEHVHVEFL